MPRRIAGRTGWLTTAALLGAWLAGCATAPRPAATPPAAPAEATYTVPAGTPDEPLRFVVYGDMRFTDPRETVLSSPGARRALVERIAAEHPRALFLLGDVPLRGGHESDYAEFAQESAPWREPPLPLFPVLGNHEFQACDEALCLANWWRAFPLQQGRRWYTVQLGSRLRVLALDSNAELTPGSEQSQWLAQQLAAVPSTVRFILLLLHHPPYTDAARPARANEIALAAQLRAVAPTLGARLIVCGAHVHNYERFEHDGISYLVSGGGGAQPTAVQHSSQALYRGTSFPNFHYLRFELSAQRLEGEMVRLADPEHPDASDWEVADRFSIESPRPRG